MSYILEALADSELERQQIAAAPKYSLLPVVGEELPTKRRWPYALAGALLVNAAVLQVWLHAPTLPGVAASSKSPTVPQVAESPAAAPEPRIAPFARSEEPVGDVAGIAQRAAVPPQSRPERSDDRRVARPPVPADAISRTTSARSANDGAPIHMPKTAPKAIAKRSTEAAVATEATPTPTVSEETPKLGDGGAAELPPALQRELPVLSVAGFIRDEGSGSMVIVNERLVREGDEVAPGVKLEKILNDSLVFNYKGYRFKR
jgi:general secretion pathway protein B